MYNHVQLHSPTIHKANLYTACSESSFAHHVVACRDFTAESTSININLRRQFGVMLEEANE